MAAALELPLLVFRTALAQTHAARSESLDNAYSDHSQWFASDDPDPHDGLEQDHRRRVIAAAIATLPEREGQVRQL